MRYLVWVGAGYALRALPLAVAYRVADVAGAVAFLCWRRGRANMLANYAVVMPAASERRRRTVARRSLQNYCRYLVDFMRLPATPEGAMALVEDGGGAYKNLSAAMSPGRGVVVVCMHFGNWDLGAGATAARSFEAAAIAERFGDVRLDSMVFGARERLGLRIFPFGDSLLPVIRHLRDGGLLAILLDRPAPADGVSVTFFGRQTTVPAGPARLTLRTGCGLAVAAFPRRHPGAPAVEVLASFGLETSGSDEETLTQAVMTAHEQYIRRWPDQWYMFRRMWPEEAQR